MKGACSAWFTGNERDKTPMNKIVHYIGLDVHKDSIAPQHSTEVRPSISLQPER
jgi:hypothetical protein